MFTSPGQVCCNIFGINIYFYGVVMALAISVGVLVADWIGTKYYNLKKETFIDFSPYLILMGIIGARIYYCILNYDFYLRFPTEIFALRHGGISIHGAIIGGIIGLFYLAKINKLSFYKLADISVIGLALAQSIGRWGNFFNSEAFGGPCSLPWKLYIAPQYRPVPFEDCEFFHPAFLYESILDFIIFIVLFLYIRKYKTKSDGNIMFAYLILYSAVRIFVETIRIDSVRYICGYPIALLVSLGIMIISLFLYFKKVIQIKSMEGGLDENK